MAYYRIAGDIDGDVRLTLVKPASQSDIAQMYLLSKGKRAKTHGGRKVAPNVYEHPGPATMPTRVVKQRLAAEGAPVEAIEFWLDPNA